MTTLAIPAALHHAPNEFSREFFSKANFLVLKLTDFCNLRCTYCHQDALNGKAVLMPIETLKNAVRLVLKTSIAPVVNVQFHGGEPLLQPDEFFREAVAWCRQELETPTRRVNFYIQTNLTKVNEAREQLLRELKIGISFSVDGPPKINDEMRGGGAVIFKNFKRLKANAVETGTICLIQPANWDRMPEVLDYFRQEGMTNVRFNMMVPDGRGETKATASAEKLFSARAVIFQQMLEHGDAAVIDSTLYNQMKRFVKPIGAPSSFEYHGCESLYCQAGRSLFSINPDGAFHACDRIAERPAWKMGSVNQEFAAPELAVAKGKRSAFQHKDEWWSRCEGCDAKKICEFSCSAYYVDKVDTREVECQQTKLMWQHFLEHKKEIIKFMDDRSPPLQVDGKVPLRAQDQETWVLRDLQADTLYGELSSLETIAANRHYRLVRRGEQYYLCLIERAKLFEVDSLVAAIARFNGCVSPQMIESLLGREFAPGQLRETLTRMQEAVPEVFFDAAKALATQPLYEHAPQSELAH